MRKIVFGLLVFVLTACAMKPHAAQATTCTQAFVFATGQTLTAANLNANPANEITCINNIDNNNIGSNGIYATQIKPTSIAQAAFGGTVAYTFPNAVLATQGGTAGYVPPVYTNAGSATASTEHIVRGQALPSISGTCSASSSCTLTGNTVTLSGAAAFSTAGYCTVMNVDFSNYPGLQPYITGTVTSTITFQAYNASLSSRSSTPSLTFNYICVGS